MKHLRHIFLGLAVLCIVVLSGPVKAGNSNYETKTLPNGIRLIYKVLPDSPTVTARFVVPVGFLDEPKELAGISHLLEHLIYRGNAKYTPADFRQAINDQSGYYNGGTWLDKTEFFMVISSEVYFKAFTMYADMIMHPDLTDKDVNLEKKIVMIEKANRKLPGDIGLVYYNQITNQRYDYDVAHITRDDILQYHQKYYRTDQLTVIVTGAFNLDEVVKCLSGTSGYKNTDIKPTKRVVDYQLKDLDTKDYLQGEKYKLLYSFDLKGVSGNDLIVAKILPWILAVESGHFDNATNRVLDYDIGLISFGENFNMIFDYRDCQDAYTPELINWHQKNLDRYCKFLENKNFDKFLSLLTESIQRSYQTLDSDSYSLNEYYFNLLYDPTMITEKDLSAIRSLKSSDIKHFVQKYIDGKPYHKIIIRAVQE